MKAYVAGLQELFRPHANPVDAVPMKAYMRDQFEYLGIKMPQQRALLKEFISEHSLPELEALPEREFQYAAQGLLGKFEQSLPADFIDTIERLLTSKSCSKSASRVGYR